VGAFVIGERLGRNDRDEGGGIEDTNTDTDTTNAYACAYTSRRTYHIDIGFGTTSTPSTTAPSFWHSDTARLPNIRPRYLHLDRHADLHTTFAHQLLHIHTIAISHQFAHILSQHRPLSFLPFPLSPLGFHIHSHTLDMFVHKSALLLLSSFSSLLPLPLFSPSSHFIFDQRVVRRSGMEG
jgi:hypothetical protein